MSPSELRRVRVLVVDDDEDDYLIAHDLLTDITSESHEYQVAWVASARDALDRMLPNVGEPLHDVCLLDYRLGAESGLEILRLARERGYQKPVILLSGQDDPHVDQAALNNGASDYLIKGRFDPSTLERAIRYALAQNANEEVLRSTAAALAEARRRESDMSSAIQRMLLQRKTSSSHYPGVSVGVCTLGAEKIDGDYFEVLPFREGCVDILLADVMGKGIAAALIGAAVKSQFQAVARRLANLCWPFGRIPEPEEIVGSVHAIMALDLIVLESFVTLNYARIDWQNRTLTYVDAGHLPLIHGKADGSVTLLSGDNLPLGISAGEFYVQHTVSIEPGDYFVVYSDGVTEASPPGERDEFGEDRLIAVVHELLASEPDAQVVADRIIAQVQDHRQGQGDDMTVLVVKIHSDRTLPITPPLARRVLEINSHPDSLSDAREFAENSYRECAPDSADDGFTDLLVLALTEALANIMKHAYEERSKQHILILAEFWEDRVQLRLQDRGRPFDPNLVPEPTFDGSKDSGFGWFIVNEVFDSVLYQRDDLGWNHLTLVKHWTGDSLCK